MSSARSTAFDGHRQSWTSNVGCTTHPLTPSGPETARCSKMEREPWRRVVRPGLAWGNHEWACRVLSSRHAVGLGRPLLGNLSVQWMCRGLCSTEPFPPWSVTHCTEPTATRHGPLEHSRLAIGILILREHTERTLSVRAAAHAEKWSGRLGAPGRGGGDLR